MALSRDRRSSEERQESLESPRGGYQIVVAERGNRAVERLEVRHCASGATFGLPRMTQRQHLRFSNDDRWLVFWDDRGVEVLDLKERRHVGKFDIANVHAASSKARAASCASTLENSRCWCHWSSR